MRFSLSLQLAAIRRWGAKGTLAILEQALFSGSNFVLNILLARWLSPEGYGAFAVGFAVYLFLSGFQNALILEPMSVLATSNYLDLLHIYLPGQFVVHFSLTVVLGALTAGVAASMLLLDTSSSPLAGGLLGVGLFLPFMLLIWLVRRVYYVLQRPQNALICSAVYAVALISGAFLVHTRLSVDDIFPWFALIGIASLVGSVLVLFTGQLQFFHEGKWIDLRLFAARQWLLGRSIFIATLLYSLGTQVQVFIAASFLGLQAAGAYRAVQNFMLPMSQVLTAGTTLTFPAITAEFGKGDFRKLQTKSQAVGIALTTAALVYELALIVGARWVPPILYAGKFTEYAWLIPIIGLVPLFNALETAYSLLLRSLQRPSFYVIDKAVAAFVGAASALILVLWWGLTGAVVSLVLIEVAALCTYFWLYRRWFVPRLAEPGRAA